MFSLAHLTFAPLAPPEAIRLAARLGYGAVGLRALPAAAGGAFSPLVADAALRRETRAAIEATGVGVLDMEIVRLGAGFTIETVRPFLAVSAELGARAVLVAGDDPDRGRLVASFATLAEAAASFGLTADLEFMPWTAVPDARTALAVVEAAGASNGGVLVDALHFARSETSLDDVAAIPRERLHYAQFCDAPAEIPATVEGLIHDARHRRLLPGDGGIDLAGLVARLPADLPIGLELPNETAKAELGVEAWAARAIERARRLFVLSGSA
ncbi:MAG: sugar phosphate isomerase/epimerase [Siculibacillus sp.]|nr:sugar phosphate isomerase/epimerase [Siculibacillus sp.]